MHVTERLRALRERAGLTREELAIAAGYRGASSIQRYEDHEKFTRHLLDVALVERLRPHLVGRGNPPIIDDDVDDLFMPQQRRIATAPQSMHETDIHIQDSTTVRYVPANEPHPANAQAVGTGVVDIRRRIPLYGQAIGGDDGEFILNGNRMADVLAPSSLTEIDGAYAVQVVGESMEPRYDAGEIVYVNPKAAIRKNDYVVVQIATTEGAPPLAYIKRFVKVANGKLYLSQFNPPKTLEFDRTAVVSIHRIVLGGEG